MTLKVGKIEPENKKGFQAKTWKPLSFVARPARFEHATPWFVVKYSIQLSYGRQKSLFIIYNKFQVRIQAIIQIKSPANLILVRAFEK